MEWEIFTRLLTATLLGGLIGLERERTHRAAGLRTHVLVSIGSALFTMIGFYAINGKGVPVDPTRIAAQIVSGIGFLGAGTIMRYGVSIKGLTTAASLWSIAGIGMACGTGFYLGAVSTTFLVLVSLTLLKKFEAILGGKPLYYLEIKIKEHKEIPLIYQTLDKLEVSLKNLEVLEEDGLIVLKLYLQFPKNLPKVKVTQQLTEIGVTNLEWEEK
ncbi:MAG: MgtC/SapB family protein [Armatimonadetes bacterium]|nr:MgtC/SapB family protein [Armatimonadota bacterium]